MLLRYQLGGVFAQGAQARLLNAVEKSTRARCLVKMGPTALEEALLCIELNHPCVVQPLDCGTDPDQGPFAVYPFVEGASLKDVCREDPERLHMTVFQIADFLAFLHQRGWLYNDFKPEHFLVGERQVRILDLGLCSPLHPNDRSVTYSGTFPYISPERLLGRPHDGRSDLYALGLLLLGAFFPEAVPSSAPALNTLLEFQHAADKLRGKWRDLILDLTSWEPAQRPASAVELWKRLLKPAGAKSPLFFPVPFYRSIPLDELTGTRVHYFSSPSALDLSTLQRQLTLTGCHAGYPVANFDIVAGELDAGLRMLTHSVCGAPAGDVYDAVKIMSGPSETAEQWIVLRLQGAPQAREDSLLSFLISALESKGYRFFLLSQHPRDLLIEGCKAWPLPTFDSKLREGILNGIFCDDTAFPRPAHHILKSFTQAEQVYNLFSDQLRQVPQEWWPAAASVCRTAPTSYRLSPGERRLLGALEIAGGTLCRQHVNTLHPGKNVLELLELKGLTQSEGDRISLVTPDRRNMRSFRRKQIREIGRTLLEYKCSLCDLRTRYFISLRAGKGAVAAEAALQRSAETTGNDSVDWMCRAYLAGSHLTRAQACKLASKLLLRSKMKMAHSVLMRIRKQFGMSFRLGELFVDYEHRQNALNAAMVQASHLAEAAERRSNPRMKSFFQIRLAGLHLLNGDIEQGERLLDEVGSAADKGAGRLRGMMQHLRGLGFLLRGNVSVAQTYFEEAIGIRHRFRATSLMNLGIVHVHLGDLKRARHCLLKAARQFSRKQDAERLAHVHINLGVIMKKLGSLGAARDSYFKAIHLSRASGNRNLEAAALGNLAMTYASEGRTRLSIEISRRAARAARRAGLRDMVASCLNNMGLQYAVRSQLPQSLTALKKSLEIRKKLLLKRGLAATYEHLGLAWLMNRKPVRARPYLVMATRLFEEAGAGPDHFRSSLLLTLSNDQAMELVSPEKAESSGDLEMGLYHYVAAQKLLKPAAEEPAAECLEHIHEAEIRFRKAPALYWLGKTLQAKAEYFSRIHQHERAWLTFVSSHNIFTRLGARQELRAFSKAADVMNIPRDFLDRMAEKLPYRMLQLVRNVLAEGSPDRVVRRILDASMEFTGMERAVLLLQEDPPRVFMSTAIDDDTIREFREISNFATQSVSESRQAFVATDADTNEYLYQRPSIIRNRIVSIACLPLQVQDRLIGYLYLDSREGVESLAAMESTLLDIFASLVALILNNSMILERSIEANDSLRASLGLKEEFPEIVGSSTPILEMLKTVHHLLDSDIPVLITGETGTGKELIARVLHYCGKRREGPFVAVNSAALTESLLESEIFGHEKGAFTGASQARKGLFEEARNGTLFLDEIGDMPRSTQAKFLRVLQDGEFRRVGGNQVLHTNARVVLATNRILQDLVESKAFREDLYYRVLGAQVHVPALRERKEDIPILAAHFLKAAAGAAGKNVRGISPEAMEVLKNYAWPGNVRQLKTEIERMVALIDHEWIIKSDLSPAMREGETPTPEAAASGPMLREIEREIILERLKSFDWNILLTAKSLGLTRNGLYSKMKLYGISKGA